VGRNEIRTAAPSGVWPSSSSGVHACIERAEGSGVHLGRVTCTWVGLTYTWVGLTCTWLGLTYTWVG
jgi:hypothetical protein